MAMRRLAEPMAPSLLALSRSRCVLHPSPEESQLGAPGVLHPNRTLLGRPHLQPRVCPPMAGWTPRPAVGSLPSMPSSPVAAWSSTASRIAGIACHGPLDTHLSEF
jgi:hypothetical protein